MLQPKSISGAKKLLTPVWSRVSDMVVEKALGAWITTVDGRRVLDLTTGIAVCNTGHCHPRVVEAARSQLGEIMHAQMNIVHAKSQLCLAEKLAEIMPDPSLDRFFFSNSGAEAIEGAVKLSKQVTRRPNIICFEGSFHGRTLGTLSMTSSKNIYSRGVGGHVPGIYFAKYPYMAKHTALNITTETVVTEALQSVEDILKMTSAPSDTAAICLEPILGEGGYVPAPPSFLRGLREICDREGILLIMDEIQTGFGRTGSWFATSVRPDILVMAKGIGSGLPLSAVAANGERLMDKWIPGSHGGTYGGNAVSCAAACATIDVIREERLLENAVARGEQAKDRLGATDLRRSGIIKDVRGPGLMIGVEFDYKLKGIAGLVCAEAQKRNLLLMGAGARETIRLMPPLVINEKDMDMALTILEQSIRAALSSPSLSASSKS